MSMLPGKELFNSLGYLDTLQFQIYFLMLGLKCIYTLMMSVLTIGGNKEGLECFSKMSPIVPCSWVDLEYGAHKDTVTNVSLQILFHF